MRLDYRWLGANDLTKRAAAAAAEIAGLRPTVIVAVGAAVSLAMQRATSTIPIVFAVVSDPIAQGLVSQLAHPGGNITGFSLFEPGMGGKWLDLLKKMYAMQMEVLRRLRQGGHQYVRVEHVHVSDGGQASLAL
jgi:putative ABC transport system substrate-binding protein